jgi:hypothetical protein
MTAGRRRQPQPLSNTPEARRQRRAAERRRRGTVVLTIPVEASAIDRLIKLGWLDADNGSNRQAIFQALLGFVSHALDCAHNAATDRAALHRPVSAKPGEEPAGISRRVNGGKPRLTREPRKNRAAAPDEHHQKL